MAGENNRRMTQDKRTRVEAERTETVLRWEDERRAKILANMAKQRAARIAKETANTA